MRGRSRGALSVRPLPVGTAHVLDALLDIDLVEAEGGGGGAREAEVGMLPELPHGGKIGQALGIVEEVMERDEGVSLPASVRHLELTYGLGALARQTGGDIPHQLPQRVRGGR